MKKEGDTTKFCRAGFLLIFLLFMNLNKTDARNAVHWICYPYRVIIIFAWNNNKLFIHLKTTKYKISAQGFHRYFNWIVVHVFCESFTTRNVVKKKILHFETGGASRSVTKSLWKFNGKELHLQLAWYNISKRRLKLLFKSVFNSRPSGYP